VCVVCVCVCGVCGQAIIWCSVEAHAAVKRLVSWMSQQSSECLLSAR